MNPQTTVKIRTNVSCDVTVSSRISACKPSVTRVASQPASVVRPVGLLPKPN